MTINPNNGPEPHPDPKLEAALRRAPESRLDDAAFDALRERTRAALPTAPARQPWNIIVGGFAVAAVAVGAVSLFWPAHNNSNRTATPVAVKSAADTFAILQTDTAAQAAVIQPFDTFKVARRGVGDSIGAFQLQHVDTDALALADAQGLAKHLVVAAHNAEARQRLATEAAGLQQRYLQQGCSAADLERTGLLALAGEAQAIKLLETIGDGVTPEAGRARELLAANQQVSALRQLIEMARQTDPEVKRQALRVLAGAQSPLALQCLKEIALQSDATTSVYIIQQLGKHPSSAALCALSDIAATTSADTVRNAANTELSNAAQPETGDSTHAK